MFYINASIEKITTAYSKFVYWFTSVWSESNIICGVNGMWIVSYDVKNGYSRLFIIYINNHLSSLFIVVLCNIVSVYCCFM